MIAIPPALWGNWGQLEPHVRPRSLFRAAGAGSTKAGGTASLRSCDPHSLRLPNNPLAVLETDLEIALVVARNGPRLKQVMRQPAGLTKLPRKGLSAAGALQVVSSIRSRVVGLRLTIRLS